MKSPSNCAIKLDFQYPLFARVTVSPPLPKRTGRSAEAAARHHPANTHYATH
jgi:hypothetical protein